MSWAVSIPYRLRVLFLLRSTSQMAMSGCQMAMSGCQRKIVAFLHQFKHNLCWVRWDCWVKTLPEFRIAAAFESFEQNRWLKIQVSILNKFKKKNTNILTNDPYSLILHLFAQFLKYVLFDQVHLVTLLSRMLFTHNTHSNWITPKN